MHTRQRIQFGQRGQIRAVGGLLALALAASLLVTLLLAPPADGQGRQHYGVSPQGSLVTDDYRRMARGGVGTLRFPLSWRSVERSPGQFEWGSTDEAIGKTAAWGIRTLPVVLRPPDHVRRPPTRARDRRAFRRFMRQLTIRYGRGGEYWQPGGPFRTSFPGSTPQPVRSWQLFNEQNSRHHWGGRPWPRAYGRLVRAGARGIRSVNRQAEVVLGGMFGHPAGMPSARFLNRVYRRVKGTSRAIDTVAVHPYAGRLRGLRRQMRRIRRVMLRNNQRGARIRVTELSWGAERGGHRLLKGPRGQGRMMRRSFRLLARHRNRKRGWNVGGVIWWSWQDGTAGCPFCASSGLVTGPPSDRQARNAYWAFRRFAR